jgi:hypothetical protein
MTPEYHNALKEVLIEISSSLCTVITLQGSPSSGIETAMNVSTGLAELDRIMAKKPKAKTAKKK